MNSDAALRAQTDPFTLGNRAIFSALTAWAPLAAIVRGGNRTSTVPRTDGIDAERAANVGKVPTSFPGFLVTQAGYQLMPDGRNSRTVDIRADYIVQWATDVLNVVPLNVCKWETFRAFHAATDNFGLGFVRGRQFRDAQEGAAIVIPGPGDQGTGGTAGWVTSGVISLEMCFSKTGLATWGSALSITHYYSTAENSGTLDSIISSDLAGVLHDDGMAQNGSINRAKSPTGSYTRPPDQTAWQNLADIAAARAMPLTVEAEGDLRYAYDLWQSDNATCRAIMQDVATGLGYMRAKQPGVELWVEHQSQLAANLPAPAGYADFMAHEASLIGGLISGCTILGDFESLDLAAWDARLDFYRATLAQYYPGKRVRIIAYDHLYDGITNMLFIGTAAIQHVVDYAAAHGCDLEWWQASVTAPILPETLAFLRSALLV